FLLALGVQLKHKAAWGDGGCLTRHSHDVRVRLGGLTIWRIQCTRCKVVFTVLPHFPLRYRQIRPEVARGTLLATHGGLSLAWCAVISHISPMALYRLGIVKLMAERKNPFHSAGLSSGFEVLTFHLGVKNGLETTSMPHSPTLLCCASR